jgi:hypothetical protein
MGSLPVATILAEQYVTKQTFKLAWTVFVYFVPSTAICFTNFFFNIEKKYWHTFFSTQTGKDKNMSHFKDGINDATKSLIFKYSRHHWDSIKDEVGKWVELNWNKWEEERPEWFTDQRKALVPVEFIPTTGEARRRESVRRASVNAGDEGGLGLSALSASVQRATQGTTLRGDARVVPIQEEDK